MDINSLDAVLHFLSYVPNVGAVSAGRLYETITPLNLIYTLKKEELMLISGIGRAAAEAVKRMSLKKESIFEEYMSLEKAGVKFITVENKAYPKRLLNLYDKPMWLYLKGEFPADEEHSVAIVGSRAATNYGKGLAELLSNSLAKRNINIISGMALGIDEYAHRGALKHKGAKTYAVLGCGINVCYPKENFDIYSQIAEGRGGIISEYTPKSNALKHNFPVRNRIISGLSDIIIVAEAREKSGSMITVKHALNQGKEVYALPGRITDPMSRGCNRLISEGAGVVLSVDSILESLGLIKDKTLIISEKNINSLAKNEKKVYSCFDLEPKYLEDVIKESRLPPSEVISIVLDLELRGYLIQISGNYYGRNISSCQNLIES